MTIFSAPALPSVIVTPLRVSPDLSLSQCVPFQSFKFDAVEVSSGNKMSTCDFTIVLQDEEIESINIECSTKPKKKMTIKVVLTSKTMKKFSLTFTLQKSKTKVVSSSVETGSYSHQNVFVCKVSPQFPANSDILRSATLTRRP